MRAMATREQWRYAATALASHRIAWIRRLLGTAVVAGLVLLPTFTASPYLLSLGGTVAIDAALGLSVIVLMGFAGELSFAYGVLFGSGAYIAWVVLQHTNSEWLAVVAGTVGTVALGAAVAVPAVRVRGLQLALATYAMGLAGLDIFARLSGYGGALVLQPLSVAGHAFVSPADQVVFWGVILGILYIVVSFILAGRLGRRLLLLKSDEATGRSLGISTTWHRGVAFGLSALIGGLVGTFYPQTLGSIEPTSFSFQIVVTLLIMVFIGGIGWPEGALLGGVAVVALGQVSGSTPGVESIIYGGLLFLLLAVAPRGALGLLGTDSGRSGTAHDHSKSSLRITEARHVESRADAGNAAAPREAARPQVADKGTVALRVCNISKSFGDLHAVSDVDFDLRYGEISALVGANGAGKSTLVDLISGFQAPDSGSVLFYPRTGEGYSDIARLRSYQIARLGVVRTFQFPGVVGELSLLDNVLLAAETRRASRRIRRATAQQALEMVGLGSQSGLIGMNLPHGTKKLLDLARVLCMESAVVLLDEPSSGLGEAELPVLATVVNKLAELGAAVMLVEHNIEFIMDVAEFMVVMDLGHVLGSGRPEDVLTTREVREAYVGTVGLIEGGSASDD